MTAVFLEKLPVNDDDEMKCAEKPSNRLPNIPGCPGIQSDVRGMLPTWHWTIWSASILANFSSFLPTSKPCGATLKPRRSQNSQSKCHPNSKRSTGNFTEVENEHPTSRSGSVEREVPPFWACQLHDLWSAVTIPPLCLPAISESGKNSLLILDTPVFTDCKNMDSTLREEPPKTVTFYENVGRSCNKDHSG